MALSERPKPFRDSSLFVVGLEGEVSGAEFQYFQEVLKLRLFDWRRIRFELLPTPADRHRSDPEAVFERVKQYVEKYGLRPFDRAWIALDFDTWGVKKLSSVAKMVRQCAFKLAVSNPCFELWLLLHHESFDLIAITAVGTRGRSAAAKTAWRAHKVAITPETVGRACSKAQQLAAAQKLNDRWPSCPGSDVYRLFADLASQAGFPANRTS